MQTFKEFLAEVKLAEISGGTTLDFGIGMGIDLRKIKMVTKTTVASNRQPSIELPIFGLNIKQQQSDGDTSKPAFPMPKYKTKPRNNPR